EGGPPARADALAGAAPRPGPRAARLVAASRAAAARGQDAIAEQRVRAALALDPDHPAALRDLAARVETREPAQARALLRRAEARGDLDATVQPATLHSPHSASRTPAPP